MICCTFFALIFWKCFMTNNMVANLTFYQADSFKLKYIHI